MNIKTPRDLPTLQKEYNQMVRIAMDSLDKGVDLDPRFEAELTRLMRVVKAMGGKI